MLKFIFMGTPEFALPALESVKSSGHKLLAVVTQPDRPKGRGHQLAPPPVKVWADNNQVPVLQPDKIKGNKEFIKHVSNLDPDLIITCAYGQILSSELLNIPSLGCINIHASLLPEYRGASPIQQALIDGKEKTGITIFYMDEGMDTGDIIIQKELEIHPDENAGELHDRLSELGGKLLTDVIKMFEKGKPEGIPQDDDKATYCGKIDKSMGEISWDQPAYVIRNLIRGLTPWPGAYTFINQGKRLKIWKAIVETEDSSNQRHTPGTVIKADQSYGLQVACGQGIIRIVELQEQGGRRMSDVDYLRGNLIKTGTKFGRA